MAFSATFVKRTVEGILVRELWSWTQGVATDTGGTFTSTLSSALVVLGSINAALAFGVSKSTAAPPVITVVTAAGIANGFVEIIGYG